MKFNIFKRINTGELPRSAQEIRHALNQGKVTSFLKDLAESSEFKRATANWISPKRMGDRECVLRFLAFTMIAPKDYKESDFDAFLDECMSRVNRLPNHSERHLVTLWLFVIGQEWVRLAADASG